MLYELSAPEIAAQLLQQAKPFELLAKSDKEILEWKKKDALRKMPIEIQPNSEVRKKEIEPIVKTAFTSMLSMVKQKAYKYERSNADTMSKVFIESMLKMKEGSRQEKLEEGEFKLEEQKGEQMVPGINENERSVKNSVRSQSQKQLLRPDQVMGSYTKQFAPFVSNSENPYDRHANSKLIKNERIHFDGKMRNIAALIEKNKKINHFKTQGTFLRPASTQKRDPNVDINEIMRYTLGEKRQRESGYKPEPLKNPFVRVPAKYSHALNDFYTTG